MFSATLFGFLPSNFVHLNVPALREPCLSFDFDYIIGILEFCAQFLERDL